MMTATLIPCTSPLDLPHGLDNRYLNNWEALTFLKSECDKLNESSEREYVIRVTRLYAVVKLLLDRFADEGIVVTPRVRTNTATIDLLVRSIDKRMFALSIRSADAALIIWREARNQFFVKKPGQQPKRNDPLTNAMDELQTIVDLKKARHPLIGVTNAERNTALIKAIILSPGAKIATSNPPAIVSTFGEADILKIKNTSVTYVVQSDRLIEFLLPPPQ